MTIALLIGLVLSLNMNKIEFTKTYTFDTPIIVKMKESAKDILKRRMKIERRNREMSAKINLRHQILSSLRKELILERILLSVTRC